MFRLFSMRISSGLRTFALLALGLMAVANRIEAQYVVQYPTNSAVSNTITFMITVTNQEGSVNLTMTNTIVGTTFQLGPATTSLGTYSVGSTNVIFQFGSMTNSQVATTTMAVTPTSVGSLSNLFSFATNGVLLGFGTFTPVVQVTNSVPGVGLAVAMTGPTSQVFSNDWMVYSVNVTNLGPGNATNIFLTNALPSNVGYKTNSLALKRLGSGSNVVFNLGILTNQAFINLHLTVQPTNAGTLTFVSVVSTNGVIDSNPTNIFSLNVVVSDFFAGQLTAVTNSPQTTNFQNGFIEQNILLSNTGTNAVAAARVVVTGLTNRLFNAVGTNNGYPFVVYAAKLDTNQSVNLLLQFYSTTMSAFRFTNSQLQAYAVSVPNLTPPAVTATSTNINIYRIIKRSNGSMLIEWPTVTNQTYTVVYSDDAMFANAKIAPPSIVAPANRTQWIDYGPPTTVSHPTNAPIRFYRVFLNP